MYLIILMDKPVIKLANRIFLHKQKFYVFRNPESGFHSMERKNTRCGA